MGYWASHYDNKECAGVTCRRAAAREKSWDRLKGTLGSTKERTPSQKAGKRSYLGVDGETNDMEGKGEIHTLGEGGARTMEPEEEKPLLLSTY